jgi:hypothetical protein
VPKENLWHALVGALTVSVFLSLARASAMSGDIRGIRASDYSRFGPMTSVHARYNSGGKETRDVPVSDTRKTT